MPQVTPGVTPFTDAWTALNLASRFIDAIGVVDADDMQDEIVTRLVAAFEAQRAAGSTSGLALIALGAAVYASMNDAQVNTVLARIGDQVLSDRGTFLAELLTGHAAAGTFLRLDANGVPKGIAGSNYSIADDTAINAGTPLALIDAEALTIYATEIKSALSIGGGVGGIGSLVEDTSPQLGGDLDMQAFLIEGASAAEIGRLVGVTSAIQTQLNAKQPLDTDLTAIAALTSAANKLPYATGAGTWDLADLTAAGRALLDDADATAQRATLGLTIGTHVQAFHAILASLAGQTIAADTLPYGSGSNTFSIATLTAAGRALLDDANAAAQRTTLGLVIGTDVQAFDADTLKADTADTLTAGFDATTFDAGTKSSGTFAPVASNGNQQKCVNGGAFTLDPPTTDTTIRLKITNNASAGTITTSGFDAVTGNAFTTTNGDKFFAYMSRDDTESHLHITALQ